MALDLRKIDPNLNYALKQVAELLDISYQTVLKLRKEIKTIKIGKKYFVQGEEILRYVQEGNKDERE